MEFNQCHVVRFKESKNNSVHQYKLGDTILNTADREKDHEIFISRNLSPNDHLNEKVHKI